MPVDGIQEALGWKQSIRDYVKKNGDLVRGAPPGNIVFYELYNSIAQIKARTHPALIATQRALLSLWHCSDASTPVSLSTPVSYFDRLRIRPPGPTIWTLGAHIDSGGLERWEDPGFRACFDAILDTTSDASWRQFDSFDVTPRLDSVQDMYDGPSRCSIFRPWQGWTAMSHTAPGEGTLRVLPMLNPATAYIMLRPFFRLRPGAAASSLHADDWVLDLESTEYPGNALGKTQELNEQSHPHLQLDKTLVSIPRVSPGDQVYWHCELVHAVESDHTGLSESSVLYIPACPLTERNAHYLRKQKAAFTTGNAPPDFLSGDGEAQLAGRAKTEDVKDVEGRRLLGLEPFAIPAGASAIERELVEEANVLLA